MHGNVEQIERIPHANGIHAKCSVWSLELTLRSGTTKNMKYLVTKASSSVF